MMNRMTEMVAAVAAASIVLAMTALPQSCAAQSNFMGGVHFATGLPQGEFDDQIDREAYGVGGQIFCAPHQSPLAVGLDLSWANYGSESREEPFSSTIPDVRVDVVNANNFVQALFVLRAQSRCGPIQPYGDALIGVNYLYTETTVESDDNHEDVASSTNQDDAALAYGAGGGVMVPVWGRNPQTGGLRQVLLDAGVRYVKGGEAEYLREGSIRRRGDRVEFDPIESRTDMLNVHLGLMLRF